MPAGLISLDEASWRLQQSGISGLTLAELLAKSSPLLLGVYPGHALRDPIDLSRMTAVRLQPRNILVADDVTWTDVMLEWLPLRAAFEQRGRTVSWWFAYDITPETQARARQPLLRQQLWDEPGPRRYLMVPRVPSEPEPARRASDEWFSDARYIGSQPASGNPPRGKRGPKSGKRENTAAAMRKNLLDKVLTVSALQAMPEKELAYRYQVSRDTARKARQEALRSFVEVSKSTNDN